LLPKFVDEVAAMYHELPKRGTLSNRIESKVVMAGRAIATAIARVARPSRFGEQSAFLSGMPGTRPGMTTEKLNQAGCSRLCKAAQPVLTSRGKREIFLFAIA
jgi:hypothetical protein